VTINRSDSESPARPLPWPRAGDQALTAVATPTRPLPFHPDADVFPLMTGKEFDELVGDIQRRGLRIPIVTHNAMIIDGRNRARACTKAGVEPAYTEFQGTDEDVPRFIIRMNIHRRHLKPEERREFLKRLLRLSPRKSDRTIAREAGVDHKTVAAARSEGERRGEIPHVSTRVDSNGRRQPARRKAAAAVNGGSHENGSEIAIEGTEGRAIELDASDAEPPPVAHKKPSSRARRWSDACQAAAAAIDELFELQSEYQSWLDGLPENLQSSAVSEKLDTVCGLDFEGAQAIIDEANDADLPLGFGRD
jgi:ParB-like chromosome segregation protein Spo0J